MKPGVTRQQAERSQGARRTAGHDLSGRERELGHHDAHTRRVDAPGRRQAGDPHDDGRGHAGAAHRVLQRRQPAACARVCPPARDLDSRGARRRPVAHRPAAAHRSGGHRAAERAARDRHCLDRLKLLDSSMPPDEVPYFITWSLNARSLVYTIGISMSDRRRVRPGACLPGGAQQPAEQSQGRWPRHRRGLARPAAQLAGRRRGRAVARAAGRRLAVRPQLPQPAERERRLRHGAADDDAVLPAGRGVRGRGRQGAACRRHRPARRGAPGRPVRFRVESRADGRRRRRWRVIIEGRAVERGKEPAITFIGVDARTSPDDGRGASEGARLHRRGRDDAHGGGADQSERWRSGCGPRPIRSAAASASPATKDGVVHRHRGHRGLPPRPG